MVFSATVINKGNVAWVGHDDLLFEPQLSDVTCTTNASEPHADPAPGDFSDHILHVGHQVRCRGSFGFTPVTFESVTTGVKSFKVVLPQSSTAGWTTSDLVTNLTQAYSEVNVTASAAPDVVVSIDTAACDAVTPMPENAAGEHAGCGCGCGCGTSLGKWKDGWMLLRALLQVQ